MSNAAEPESSTPLERGTTAGPAEDNFGRDQSTTADSTEPSQQKTSTNTEGENTSNENGAQQSESEPAPAAETAPTPAAEPVEKEDTLEYFLEICSQFKLGALSTESSNPLTAQLSQLAESDLEEALRVLQKVDLLALKAIQPVVPQMEELARAVHGVLESGHQVVLAGCGATGRLSLSVENFCLQQVQSLVKEEAYRTKVKGFMAGGDAALIRSIEKFEDRVEFGVRQLHELNFVDGDLMIAITEGGETPFVIAACEEAAKVSPSVAPYFLYCNPDDILVQVADRSKRVLENQGIKKMNLTVGPMAITGSTRMQATTVQLTAVGLAIKHHAQPSNIKQDLDLLTCVIANLRYDAMAPLTRAEAQLYSTKEAFLYEADYFSITVMTDTTERAPTFSLPPFENFDRPTEPTSPVYLCLPTAGETVEQGWNLLLGRQWRPLEWAETASKTGLGALQGYDFSTGVAAKRAARYSLGADKTHHRVSVHKTGTGVSFTLRRAEDPTSVGERAAQTKLGARTKPLLSLSISFGSSVGEAEAARFNEDRLLTNLAVKCLLNAHSTLIMGLLKRYDGNVMTYVKPSNYKLIDRAARYVSLLLVRSGQFEEKKATEQKDEAEKTTTEGTEPQAQPQPEEANGASDNATQKESTLKPLPTYEEIVTRIFELRTHLAPDEPIVLKVVHSFSA